MIHIGTSYIQCVDGISRLCADVTVNECHGTLWFAVKNDQEEYLAAGRADAFVMVMLASAMRHSYDIVCEDPMSEQLHYQLCSSLIPALASAGMLYRRIAIHAPLTSESYPNKNATGTGFSGGADCLYTIMTHGKDSEYPLTHIAVFNAVTFQKYGNGYRELFRKTCSAAERFAFEQGLETVFVDTNFYEILAENDTNSFCSMRHFACALALRGLFSRYYISSFVSAHEFCLDTAIDANYDLLSTSCVSTESLTFYSSGSEVLRCEKLIRLSDWEPSYRWLHACFGKRIVGQRNCGICKKCKEAQTILYALGKLDRYKAVFDVEQYKKRFPEHLAYIMANQDDPRARQVMQVVRAQNIPVPSRVYALERQIRHAVQAVKQDQKAKEVSNE